MFRRVFFDMLRASGKKQTSKILRILVPTTQAVLQHIAYKKVVAGLVADGLGPYGQPTSCLNSPNHLNISCARVLCGMSSTWYWFLAIGIE